MRQRDTKTLCFGSETLSQRVEIEKQQFFENESIWCQIIGICANDLSAEQIYDLVCRANKPENLYN